MKTLKYCFLLVAAVTIALTAMPLGAAQKLSADELDSLIANAQTKADHLKIAAHYSALAEELTAESKSHEGMAARYQRRNLPPKVAPINKSMMNHCNSLTKSLEAAAKEARQMAADHEAMATAMDR